MLLHFEYSGFSIGFLPRPILIFPKSLGTHTIYFFIFGLSFNAVSMDVFICLNWLSVIASGNHFACKPIKVVSLNSA